MLIDSKSQQERKAGIPEEIGQYGVRLEQQFTSLAQLQHLLKDQYFLLTTQNEQKTTFQKKMNNTLFSYFKSTVNMGESTYQTFQQEKIKMDRTTSNLSATFQKNEKGEKVQQEKRLLEDQGFGDVYTFVKEILLTFSKDPFLTMALIDKYQNSSNLDSYCSLIKVIVNSMYDNIVDDNVFNKDLIKIIIFCVKKIVEDKKHYFDINLQETGFMQLILAEIIQRNDIKNYAKQIVKSTLLEIAKLDHAIDFNADDEQRSFLKSNIKMQSKQSSKSHQSPMKTNQYKINVADKKSRIKLYSEGLKLQDQKMRKGSIIKRRYRNCISSQLLQYLGINQEILFPCFSYGGNSDMKLDEEINKQLGIMLNKSQSKNESIIVSDIIFMKNIILIFFNDLFKMLYSMPPLIRISCKILYKYLNKKFNTKNSLFVVADFVINFWLVSSLQIDVAMAQATKLSPYLQKNVEQIMAIIKSIVKDNYKDIHPSFLKQFNILVTNLKVSVTNYVHEIINIDSLRIDEICDEVENRLINKSDEKKYEATNIKSYCVCISISDIKKLFDMIKDAEKQFNAINEKIIKRINRIELMTSDNPNLYGNRKDKMTGKIYKASKSFALFTQLSLPTNLLVDYNKTYNNAFKNQKSKNLLRQVLLSLNHLQTYQQFYTSNTAKDFIESLQFSEQDGALYSIDRIPLKLKLQYLQILSRKINMYDLVQQLQSQTQKRLQLFKSTWELEKGCYLKAISSINFQNDKLSLKENFIRSQIKRRKLQEFFSKNDIKLCLTSPKTRQKEIVLKTNLMKEIIDEYRQKLWLQNQSRCIHTALNLDFIKSLTGQPEKIKTKYECHINNIMKFSQILCSLPEVKERFNMIEDTIGIKEVFFEFIQYIRDYIKSKQSEYAILLENIEWLEQNIELKISKRLYDKLYPKYPLYDDISLYLRLKSLDWLTFDHLKIDQELRNWRMWEVAANHLKLIDKLRTAAEKLRCIEQATKIIVNSYMLMAKIQRAVTADDIYPLMILVLIRAAPKRLISSISFIESFASQSKLLSQEGYCFTQLKAAVHFCDNLSPENIQIFQNEAINYIEFNKKIYQKQIQYGIYFMLGRRQQSPRTQKKKMQYLKQYFKRQ